MKEEKVSPVVIGSALFAVLIILIAFPILNASKPTEPVSYATVSPTLVGPINYTVVTKNGFLGSVSDMQTMAITSAAQWEQIKNNLNADEISAIDPAAQDIILLVSGSATTGYQSEIKSMASDGNRVVVGYNKVSPGAGCLTGQVVTVSYQLITVPKTHQSYTFEPEETKNTPCN